MSVADQGSPAPSLRRLPFTVRLSPQLVNKLISQRNKPSASAEITGLLFGLAEEGSVIAQAHRKFDDGVGANGLAKRSTQDKLFEEQLSASQKFPDTASLNLIGWYAIRASGGLSASDLAYHDWYFPRSYDVALILTLEDPSNVSLELYCRTVAGLMTEEGHRVGLVRLSTAPLESALEVVPRPKIQDDFFMRAYELGEAEEGKPSGWMGTLAIKYRQVFSFLRPGGEARDEQSAADALRKTRNPSEQVKEQAEKPRSEPSPAASPMTVLPPITPRFESLLPKPPPATVSSKITIEPVRPLTDSFQQAPQAKNLVPNLAEPFPTLTEVKPKVAEPVFKVAEPTPKVLEPEPKLSEPAPKLTESVAKSPEQVVKVTQPASKVIEPIPTLSEPTPKLTEPAAKLTESVVKLPEQVVKVTQPASKVIEPIPTLTEPTPKFTEPAPKLPQPTPKLTQPAAKSTEPAPKSIAPTPPPASTSVPETALQGPSLHSTAMQTVTRALSSVAFPGRPSVNSPAIATPAVAGHKKPWALVSMIFILTSLLTFTVGAYLRRMEALPSFLQAFAPQSGLGLKVEAQGDRLLLSWNRQNALVRHSRDGLLSIEDGVQKRQVVLDASHVANGSILYHPNSDDVMFRLEVHGVKGEQMVDSMRVLEAAKPVALDLSPATPVNPPLRQETRPELPKELPKMAAQAPPVLAPQLGNGPKAKPVPASSTNAANPQARPDAAKPEVAKNEEVLATPEQPPAKPFVAPAETVAPAATTPLRQLEQQPEVPRQAPLANPSDSLASYQPPKPIRQVLPSISSLPPGILTAAGHLEIVVRVDETGKVTDARAVEGERKINSALVGSALAAARQWKFEPAVLRGKAVPSQHSIIFQFAARQ